MRKEGRCRYVIDVPTRSLSWLPGMEEDLGTSAKTAVGERKMRHEPQGAVQRAETMPINQRLVHLAMPSGTPLCAEGGHGTGSEAGTVAKSSLIFRVGISVPCLNGRRVGRSRHEAKTEKVQSLCSELFHSVFTREINVPLISATDQKPSSLQKGRKRKTQKQKEKNPYSDHFNRVEKLWKISSYNIPHLCGLIVNQQQLSIMTEHTKTFQRVFQMLKIGNI